MNREFDDYADEYERLLADPLRDRFAKNQTYFFRRKIDVLLDLLRLDNVNPAETAWLDVGCGTGELLEMGSRNFASASGCDPSAKMLQASGCKNISLQEDPRRLPYGDATFDLVTAVCVYHHVPLEDRRALGDEIRRVLKPGGRFCIFEHNPWNPATRIIVSRTPVDQNAILLSINEAIRTLQLSAFTRVASRFFLYLPEPIFRLAPALENALGGLPLGGQFAVLFHRGR